MRRAAPARLAAAATLILAIGLAPAARADEAAVERGAYIFTAAGCGSCHTDEKNHGAPLAGGRALLTPFGTFYGPNITPDREQGIGRWSLDVFKRALRHGVDDDGDFLYPVFPYTSFTGMTDQDIADLYAYLMAQPPSPQEDKPQDVKFPFGFRPLLWFWRALFFTPVPLAPVPNQSAEWNRGRYLVEAVVHCEQCHTPRNFLGALDEREAFAGNPHGPDRQEAPNITPDLATGIGKWTIEDITTLLVSGMTPDFDSVGAGMGEVVADTSKLTDADRHAIAVFIKSLPPRRATGK
jgi:mono/diheme cytochrome c family protein